MTTDPHDTALTTSEANFLEDDEKPLVSRWAVHLGRGFAAVASLALLGPLLMLVANGIMRQGEWGHVPYLYELCGYLVAVLGALGFAYAASEGENVSTTILVSRLKGRVKQLALSTGMLITAATTGLTAYALFDSAQNSRQFGERHFSAEWLLIWPARMLLVMGFTVVALIVIDQLVRSFIGSKQKKTEEV